MTAPSPVRVVFALSLVLSLAPLAQAEMVVTDTQPAGIGVPFFPVITPFTIPGYDPSLPPLESVSLQLSTASRTAGGFTYANPFSTPFFDQVTLTVDFALVLPDGFLLSRASDSESISAPPFTTVPVTFTLPESMSITRILTDSDDLQPFLQPGNVTLNVRGDFFTQAIFDPFRLSGSPQPPTTSVTLTVTYTASAIPEPGTLTLVGLGLVGVAGWGWWRRKRPVT